MLSANIVTIASESRVETEHSGKASFWIRRAVQHA